MKEKAEFGGNLQLPVGPMESSLLKVFMPNNVTFSRDAADLYSKYIAMKMYSIAVFMKKCLIILGELIMVQPIALQFLRKMSNKVGRIDNGTTYSIAVFMKNV